MNDGRRSIALHGDEGWGGLLQLPAAAFFAAVVAACGGDPDGLGGAGAAGQGSGAQTASGSGGAPTTGTGGSGVGGQAPCEEDPGFAAVRSRIERGQQIFRFETFGDEAFWGGQLGLHRAIAGEDNGGVGPGVSPSAALGLGLKVDQDALTPEVVAAIEAGEVDLDDPASTLALLQLDAVVGVTGSFDDVGNITSLGIQCALCHSTVDDAFAPGIGRRLDGWPNRDLDVGAIVASAPDLTPIATHLGVDVPTVVTVLQSWGPGKYDAELLLDGKAFQPDGRSAATLLPPAFSQAGTNAHTYTGWGSTSHWNAFVAVTQMHGQGTLYDPRLDDATKFPLAAAHGMGNIRPEVDLVSGKLADLHLYQLTLTPPVAPPELYDPDAASRGKDLFGSKGCATCHVPPLFTEPGYNLHTAEEIGIDDFQAMRSPDERYRTTPLMGFVARQKGGFYHDGRFATLRDVIEHYDTFLELDLSEAEMVDLENYLRSL